ncbi:hypothetical protein J3R83DRAFT_11837 [Lanmaoa asiatica]|nr:hypothetical protein J3R83DRAFT_11837 [Lanmaoa asiatica]
MTVVFSLRFQQEVYALSVFVASSQLSMVAASIRRLLGKLSCRTGRRRPRSAWHKQCKMTHTRYIYTSSWCGAPQFYLINHLQVVPFHSNLSCNMISPPSLPTFTTSRSIPGKPYTENEHPALSPKRSFAQLEEDQLSQLELKRHHVHPDAQPPRRAPLDPLSVSKLENRCSRDSPSTDFASNYSLVTPSSPPDLRVLHPEQPLSSGSRGIQCGGTSDTPVCSWPPPVPALGTGGCSLAGKQASLHSSGERKSSRATFLESTSTWYPPDSFQTESTTTMVKPARTTEWKSGNVLQPIRSRNSSMPSVRQPHGELWRSDSGPTKAVHEPDPLTYPTPHGLPPRRPELRRSDPDSELPPHGSASLSLALGSQPLRASEHTKVVSPIGAERSRVISITLKSQHIRNSPGTETDVPSKSPWCSSPLSPRLEAKCKNEAHVLNTASLEKTQGAAGYASMSKEDLERLLRHAVWNKYAPKIISPLSPLRTTTPALDLSADPAYQLRMPSQSNNPSPRYSKCPPRRARTVCDGHQAFDWDTTCMHCQECKRDTVGKRLLAFRYRQHHVQRNKLHAYPSRGANTSVLGDDRIARVREAFAYEMDEEEKSLWEEVAAVTGAGPLPFSRVGLPCAAAAAAHWRAVDDGSENGTCDDYLEGPDEGLFANESATLFRGVSVY